ncbi:MAG: cobyrinate a,c-diamide synthase, partial [Synechococcaceae bacterium WB9_4xC_028]|nr:cobyrinate a,c-diamide synthase [Synechococcaceae bacterium WB9_4xC_028]
MACLIAAPSSGSGKTLLTLSLIAWARQQGQSIQPFKVGPDYLDPQLLTAASGRPCRNLDLSLCGEDWVRGSFLRHGSTADLAVVEGVMGLFDGIGPSSDGSSAAVAAALQLPVVLVVDASGQAQSLAALVRGFQQHDPSLRLAGVVLNRVSSPRHRELLDAVLEGIDVPLLGSLPRNLSLELPSRHLGLAPAHELERLEGRLEAWASLAQEHLDLGALMPLLQPPSSGVPPLESLNA